ncbi:MAG TPA: hypothetical protein VN445_11515 [Rectinemataceae bacterium]|nr:hypothetical protein [Rectinemataceae bacterium]
MKPSEKTRSDLLRSLAEADKLPASARAALYGSCVDRYFGFLPQASREEIFSSFEIKRQADAAHASDWLVAMAGIFLQDYDGSPLIDSEWKELRDMLSVDSGELDMDVLTYAMGLVMEHKAL